VRLVSRSVCRRTEGWRDVHLRLAGPQQAQLAESFDRPGGRAHGRTSSASAHGAAAQLRQLEGARGVEESIHFFDSGPRGPLSRAAARLYAHDPARQRQITAGGWAYFIPVGGVLRALFGGAQAGGSGVCVIVPGQSDVRSCARNGVSCTTA